MKTGFRQSFLRDIKKLRDRSLQDRIEKAITKVEVAADLQEIANLKKIANTDNLYRIRVGDYRIGVVIEAGVVEFVRCLHRREIYRYFP